MLLTPSLATSLHVYDGLLNIVKYTEVSSYLDQASLSVAVVLIVKTTTQHSIDTLLKQSIIIPHIV